MQATLKATIGRTPYETDLTVPARDGSPAPLHTLRADEPPDLGGHDTGPTPYELLLASLAACKAITVRMYADRKGWPLERVDLDLSHDRRPAASRKTDLPGEPTEPAPIMDHVDVTLRIVGPLLSAEQRARLAEIADKCPVHKMLDAGVRVVTRIAEA